MRKVKYIALALMTSVILSGAGYAYWNDSVTINGTVNTGYFDVQFVNSDKNIINESEYVDVEAAIVEGSNNHTVRVTIENLYPGATGGFSFKIKNTGTIPAKFDKVWADQVSDPGLMDADKVLIYSATMKVLNKNEHVIGNDISILGADNIKTTYNSLTQTFTRKLQNWYGTNQPLILQPEEYLEITTPNGDSVVAGYNVYMPTTIKKTADGKNAYEDTSLGFDLHFEFKQWNDIR